MIKIIATRCHILRLKCTKFDSRRLSVRSSVRLFLTQSTNRSDVDTARRRRSWWTLVCARRSARLCQSARLLDGV